MGRDLVKALVALLPDPLRHYYTLLIIAQCEKDISKTWIGLDWINPCNSLNDKR